MPLNTIYLCLLLGAKHTERVLASAARLRRHTDKPPPPNAANPLPQPQSPSLSGPIRWRCTLHNVIYEVLRSRAGWIETESETEWDFMWAERAWLAERGGALPRGGGGGGGGGAGGGGNGGGPWQRINHFPNHQQLTRKDLLARNLKSAAREAASAAAAVAGTGAFGRHGGGGATHRPSALASSSQPLPPPPAPAAAALLPGPFDFLPPTFLLPTEYRLFADAFRRGGGGTWIMKPIGRCQGQGISLVSRAAEVERWAPDLRQRQQQQQQQSRGGGGGAEGASAAAGLLPGQQRHQRLQQQDNDDGDGNDADADDEGRQAASQQQQQQLQRVGSTCAASADAQRARYGASYCAQRYVESPYLVAGRKFDLRIYALVTSHHGGGGGRVGSLPPSPAASSSSATTTTTTTTPPAAPRLRVYLYRSGFARFAGQRYSMRKGDLADARVHLTNVAVQNKQQQPQQQGGGRAGGKGGSGDDPSSEEEEEEEGGGRGSSNNHPNPPPPPPPPPPIPPPALKWPLRELRLHVTERHGRPASDALFSAIQALVVRALLAVRGAVTSDGRCFELYGYDVLIDSDLRPWLLEVNASPSLTASDADDRALKFAMLHDALDAVGVERAAFAASSGGGGVGGGGIGSGGSGRPRPMPPPPAPPAPPRRVGGFDLVWDGGPVGGAAEAASASAAAQAPAARAAKGVVVVPAVEATLGVASLLGCYNERDEGMWRWGPRLEEQEQEEGEEEEVVVVGRGTAA
jgi:hypothetical protein